ncbi:MAG: type IV pilin [Candidatus Thermoplasmatota archaeon]|nr:type IV pilin [Candidatus Thermoplasmatota archaeon]
MRAPDAGLSAVIGTLMLTVITIVMAVGFAEFLSDAQPQRATTFHMEFGAKLDPGAGQWGTGDETVKLIHRGGQNISAATLRLFIDIGGSTSTYEDAALDGGFSDGWLEIGESWTLTTTIPPQAEVSIKAVYTGEPSRIIYTSDLQAGNQDCTTDTTAPHVSSWSQTPANVNTDTTGAVTITLTAGDACAGVDTSVTPHLYHRIENGTSPAWTDAGEMTFLGGRSWQTTIPAPATGWADHEDETLEYYADPLGDLAANQAATGTETDIIEDASNLGILTYTTSHIAFSGTVTNFDNAQAENDGAAEAQFQEAYGGTGTGTSEKYGSAHSSNGATSPGDATGAPDDTHAVLPSDNDWLGVSGFDTFSGAITKVELAFEGHATSTTADGNEDALGLSYSISGASGATSQAYTISQLGAGSDGPAEYLDVTADRTWSWADIGNMEVQATYEKNQGQDPLDLKIDALWVRVTTDNAAYNLSIRANMTGIPAGTNHVLELREWTTGETMHVDVWDFNTSSWNTRGDSLTETSATPWTYTLTADELFGGEVRIRLTDDGPDSDAQDSLWIDYIRVRTT